MIENRKTLASGQHGGVAYPFAETLASSLGRRLDSLLLVRAETDVDGIPTSEKFSVVHASMLHFRYRKSTPYVRP